MKAIIITEKGKVALQEVPQPENPAWAHLIIQMSEMGINAGDNFFISGGFPPDFFPVSQHHIAGVSGVGKVITVGEGVPKKYLGSYVTVYRSLMFSDEIVGTWSEYAHLPYLECAILPDDVDPEDYSGSLVNIITPYGMWRQSMKEGHQGMIITAGNSATGIAMLGICLNADFPVISIVRNAKGKQELEELGAKYVFVQGSRNFKEQLKAQSEKLKTTAVFDGVGGAILNDIIDVIPGGSTIYAYGFLGDKIPLSFHTSLLMKGITIKSFNNFKTETVQDPAQLEQALDEISKMIHMPHFKTKRGEKFTFEQIDEALSFSLGDGSKTILKIA
jgi:NADPH:quinone reductase-like Zn-dependent oxidoreductase